MVRDKLGVKLNFRACSNRCFKGVVKLRNVAKASIDYIILCDLLLWNWADYLFPSCTIFAFSAERLVCVKSFISKMYYSITRNVFLFVNFENQT